MDCGGKQAILLPCLIPCQILFKQIVDYRRRMDSLSSTINTNETDVTKYFSISLPV